jgi:hypothetical protein
MGVLKRSKYSAASLFQLVIAVLLILSDLPGFAANVTWITGSDGSWTTATNWSSNPSLPGSVDTVTIDRPEQITVTISSGTQSIRSLDCKEALILSGGTLTLSQSSTINGPFSLTGGTLNGTGSLTLSGPTTWSAGGMSSVGTTTLASGASMDLAGSATKTLSTRTLTIAGAMNWTGTGGISGSNAAIINNQLGGVIDAQNNASLTSSGTASILNNAGLFKKSGGTGSTSVAWAFNNTGSVQVQTGTLSLSGGGTDTGAFDVSAGATLAFAGGTHNLNAGTTMTGTGTASVSAGTVNAAGTMLSAIGQLSLSGAGVLNITGDNAATNFLWTAGTLGGTGTTSVSSGNTWDLTGTGNRILSGRTLANAGVIHLAPSGSFGSTNAAVIQNQAGGVFDIQNDTGLTVSSGSTPTINNAGVFKKSGGAGITNIAWAMNNSGAVSVESGTLSLAAGGADSGLFSVAAGATLSFAGGTHNLNLGTTFSNAGAITITGATVNAAASIVASSGQISLSSGTLNITGDHSSNNLAWSGGTLSGNGTTTVAAGDAFLLSGTLGRTLSGRVISNQGVVNWTGTGPLFGSGGAALQNEADAVFDIQNDATASVLSGVATLNNAGTIKKSAGVGTSTIGWVVNNSATIQVQSGTLRLSRGGTQTGAFEIASGATLNFAGGTHDLNPGTTIAGAGALVFGGATINIDPNILLGQTGPLTISDGIVNMPATVQSSGLITLAGGIWNLAGNNTASDFAWTGGTLGGTGTTTNAAGNQLILAEATARGLSGRTLDNFGTILATGVNPIIGDNSAVLNNRAGAIFDAQNDVSLSGAAVFNNSGLFKKSAGLGTTAISWAFNNTGQVQVQSGTLSLAGGGMQTGTYDVASGSTLRFSGGTHNLNPGIVFTGSGSLDVAGGTVNVDGSVDLSLTLSLSGGTLALLSNRTFNHLDWSGGTLAGPSVVTVPAGGTINLSSSASKVLSAVTLNNSGTITIPDNSTLAVSGTSVINNQVGAVIELEGSGSLSGSSAQTINNAGFVKKTGASLANIIALNSAGTVLVESGELFISGGTQTGNFQISSGATLGFANFGNKFKSGAVIDGAGKLNFSGDGFFDAGTIVSGTGSLSFSGSNQISFIPGMTLSRTGDWTISGPTVSVSVPVNGGKLALSSGELRLSNAATFSGGTWTGGTLSGTGVLTNPAGATFTLSGGTKTLEKTIDNFGSIVLAGSGTLSAGTVSFAKIKNQAGATIDIQSNIVFNLFGQPIDNYGTFKKSGGTGKAEVRWPFYNSGTAQVQVGTLEFSGGGTHTGSFEISAGATLGFASISGTDTFTASSAISGAGKLSVAWQTVTIPNTSLRITGPIALSSGELDVAGDLDFANLIWTGGTLGGQGVTNLPSSFTFAGDGLNQRTLVNSGTATLTGSFLYGSGATIKNLAGATFNLQAHGLNKSSSTGAAFINAGLFSSQDSQVQWIFDNSGTVQVTGGTLSLSGGGSQSGTFNIASGALLDFGGVHVFTAGSAITGPGTVIFSAGSSDLPSATLSTAEHVQLNGATLTIHGNNAFNDFIWFGGTLTGEGSTTIPANKALTIDRGGIKTLSGRMLVNAGTINWAGTGSISGGSSAVTIENQLGGVFDAQDDTSLVVSTDVGQTINNAGTFKKSAGTGTTTVAWRFNNTGTVQVQSGTLAFTRPVAQFSAGTLTGGSWQVLNGSTLSMPNGTSITTLGPNANVRLSGSTATFSAINSLATNNGVFAIDTGKNFTSASDFVNNGTLTIGTGSKLTIPAAKTLLNSGTLQGNGTIAGNVQSSGIVSPGSSPGTLTITGNLSLDSAASSIFELGGVQKGTQYDHIDVTGNLLLGGSALQINFANGFQSVVSRLNSFDLFTVTGNLNGSLSLDSGSRITTADGSGSFLLTYSASSSPRSVVLSDFLARGDFDRDGRTTAADVGPMLRALTDLDSYAAQNSLSPSQLNAIGDFDGSSSITNRDIQGLLDLLASVNVATTVPEPANIALMLIGLVIIAIRRRKN